MKTLYPKIMGILNVTPDSFVDGGRYNTLDKAFKQAELMIQEGADIIDIGGESTRPGAQAVTLEEELERIMPVILKIKANHSVSLSIDTNKPQVMQAAINAGVEIINDVYALRKPGTLETIAKSQVNVCLMHMQGNPLTMQSQPTYQDVIQDVYTFLQERIDACINAGISKERIIIDPGFGFGKTVEHNLRLVNELKHFLSLGCPILLGASRKATIGTLLNKPSDQRLYGSLALHVVGLLNGASIIRTHDVAATKDAAKIITAMLQYRDDKGE